MGASIETVLPRLREMPVVDVAEILSELPAEQLHQLLDRFPLSQRGLIVADFKEELQFRLFEELGSATFAPIFEHMPSEVRTDFYQNLSVRNQTRLLPFLDKPTREDVLHLSAYEKDSAGGIMSTDFATVQADMTIAQAIQKVRLDSPSRKMVYYVYAVNDDMELQGFISLKDLILNTPETSISELIKTEYVAANVTDDRELAAMLVEKYDLLALPVINQRGQLVGIIKHDDVLDVIRTEHTEDFEKFMGILPGNEIQTYLETSSWIHYKKRAVWIVSLAAVGIISGVIIHHFESTLEKLIILALYMPMMADAGGNSGSQAATVVVRALALGHIRASDWWRVVWKEAGVAILLAASLGLLAFAKVLFLSWETDLPQMYSLGQVGFVIALALALQVVSATLIGALLPIAVRRLGGDPAVAASPAITTIVDITGLLIYFGLAVWLLEL